MGVTLGTVILLGLAFIACTVAAFYAGRWSK